MKNTDKVTLTIGQLKKLIKESRKNSSKRVSEAVEDNKDEDGIVKYKFDKQELLDLGFREMMKADDHFWSDAEGDAVVFCNPYICMICGHDKGNRFVEVAPTHDTDMDYIMIDPSNENLKEIMDSIYPDSLLKDTTKFELN